MATTRRLLTWIQMMWAWATCCSTCGANTVSWVKFLANDVSLDWTAATHLAYHVLLHCFVSLSSSFGTRLSACTLCINLLLFKSGTVKKP